MSDKFRVLIVDDERNISDTFAEIFTQNGYQARAAYSGEEAIQIIEEWPPAVAIVDIALPGMDGIDFALLLCAKYPGSHLLFIAGQIMNGEHVAKAAGLGSDFNVRSKPVLPNELLDEVAQLLVPAQGKRTP